MSRRGGAAVALGALAGLAAVLVGVMLLVAPGGRGRAAGPDPSAAAASRPTQPLQSQSSGRTAPRALPVHARLRLPRLDVDAPVVGVQVNRRAGHAVMDVPRDPHVVGWWTGSAAPGAARGNTVVVGHVNYDGVSGALGGLGHSRRGDPVSMAGGTYRVTAVRTYPKTDGIPAAAFARGGPARLVLITCGGPFDPSSGNYEDNIVVYAEPIRAAPRTAR